MKKKTTLLLTFGIILVTATVLGIRQLGLAKTIGLYISSSFEQILPGTFQDKESKNKSIAKAGSVLGSEEDFYRSLEQINFNLPSFFNDYVNIRGGLTVGGNSIFEKDATVSGNLAVDQDLTVRGRRINFGTAIVSGGNLVTQITAGSGVSVSTGNSPVITNTGVLSLQGKSGALVLEEGDNIKIDGLKISAEVPDVSVDTFKNFEVSGQDTVTASGEDTFTFAAGTGITLTTDANTKQLTIASTTGSSGWATSAGNVYLNTITDNVGIGTSSPTSKLHVVGTANITSDLTLGGNLLINGDTFSDLTGNGLTVTANALGVNLTSSGSAGATSSNSGLEVSAAGLTLIKGCATGDVMKWNDGLAMWECAADAGASGTGIINVEEGDVVVSSSAGTMDYLANDFILTESPSGEVNVSLDYANSGITRKGVAETITGGWSFSNGLSINSGLNNNGGGITNTGTIAGATGITSSGTITLSAFATNGGLLYTSGSGTVSQTGAGTSTQVLHGGTTPSYSALSLATDVTGTLPTGNGGTGLTTYTTGDIIYASATNTLSKLAVGGSGTVLTVAGGVPSWSSVASICTTCVLTNPAATQTITPTVGTATGISIAQASGGSVDIFNVTNNGGSTKYLQVDSTGNVNIASNLAVTGTSTFSGNLIGSGSPTLSGFGTINGATISGGTLSGGSLTGGTYTSSGATVIGNYTNQINNGGTFNVYDGTQNIFTVTDAGTVGNISNVGAINASGTVTANALTINGGTFAVNSSGAITAATGITTSGTVTLSGLSTGIVHSNGSGVLSSSALNLAGASSEVTGVLPETKGGTNQSTYTTGDIIYASATNTLAKLGIGGSGNVLTVSGGLPSWQSVPGICPTCVIMDPAVTQTITPTVGTATGISVAQASGGSVDIFNVTNNGGSTKYLQVNSSGNVSLAGNLAVTGTTTLTGNLIGSSSPTLSGFGTINGATLSGGTLSGGSLTGGTYTSTGSTVSGNYTAQIGNTSSFNIYDGTQNIFTLTDGGTTGNISNIGSITAGGTISGLTGISSSGTITLSAFTTNGGLLYTNGSGTLSQTGAGTSTQVLHGGTTPSYSELSLATDVTGTLPTGNGGTGLTTYTTGDIIYASATNTLSKLAVGGSGTVLTVAGGVPTWASITGGGGICSNCIVSDPAATQTITPTVGTATGLSIAQASSGSVDIFNVTNNAGTTKYLQINSSGNVSTEGTLAITPSGAFHGFLLSPGAAAGTERTATITTADLSANRTYTFPDSTGTICLTSGNCAGAGSGVTTPGGTTDTIPKFTAAQTLGDSSITDNGTVIGFGNDINFSATTPTISIGNGNTLTINDGTNSLLTLADSGTTGTLTVNTLSASNIGAHTLTGNITGSGSPTLSGLGTINGATISGGTLSGGSLTGGAYSATGATVAGNFTTQINNGGTFNVYDGTNNIFTVTDAGTVGDLTNIGAITASGTITLSSFSTNGGLLYTNGSGTVAQTGAGTSTQVLHGGSTPSYSALSLATDVTGTLAATNGGTGLSTYTTGDIIYASATNTLSKRAIGSSGDVLSVSGGVPTWATVASLCPSCVVTNPGATQTITPTVGTATGLSIAQASGGSVDIFNVTNNGGSTKYLRVNSSGDVSLAGNLAVTGTTTLTGNLIGSASPTLSGFGTINGATLSGGSLSGGSLTGGTYTSSGFTVTGNYTGQINNGGSFNIYDGTNNIFTVTDAGTVGDLTNIGAITANGAITFSGVTSGVASSGLCLNGSSLLVTCTYGGGSMSSFTAAGDSGSSQTISDANTLSILGGTNGIDTVASATDTLTLNLDTTEIGTTTFGSGSASTWTFDASAGTDTTIAFGNNTQTFTTGTATFSGDVVGQGTTGLTLSGAGAGVTISGTGNHTISTTNAGSNLTIGTTTTGALSLDSGTTGTVSLGNGNNAKTVNIGSGTAGNTINIAGTGATGADTINIGTGGTGADTINLGSSASSTALNFTSGTGAQSFTSSVVSGTGTTSAFSFSGNSVTTGTALNIAANALTSGTGLNVSSTSTALSSGNLTAIDWSPGSATTATGDLLSLNIGTNGNIGNIFNVKDTGSSLFSVSESAITANLPANFTSPGDVSMAYDLQFTNPTASYIKSLSALTLEAGESFASSDLTLRTFNSGQLVIDAPGGTNINSVSYTWPSSQAAGSGYVLSNNGSGTLTWVAAATGSMSSFTAAGDSGSSQTISNADTLSIVGGTNGIDTVASATDTLTLNLDTTEIGTTTFGSGSGTTWTFDAGATDPTISFGSNSLNFGAGTSTFSGDIRTDTANIISSSATTGSLFNTTVTTLNIGGAATAALNLGTGNSAYTAINIGTGTGGNGINIGTNNTVADTIGIGSALDTLSLAGTTSIIGATTINGSGSLATNIGTGTSTGTITIGRTVSTDLALNDANWNISGAGAANFASVGATTPGTGAFTTLSSTGATTLGNNSSTVAVDTTSWDVSTAGVFSGLTGITSSGIIALTPGSTNDINLTLNNAGGSFLNLAGLATGSASSGVCLDASNNIITCTYGGGGSMSSFTAAGDSGSSQTISDGNTLSIVGGTNGIDTVASATDTLTLNLDTTEIGTTTFGSGSATTWTFDASGGTDTSIAFGNNTQTFTTGTATFSGDIVGQGTTGLTLSGASAGVTISGTGNHTISTTNAGSNLAIGTTTTGALTLDSGTTGAVNLGTGSNAKTVTVGNTTGATALTLNSGTGAQSFNSSVASGTGTSSAFAFNANSLTSGTGLNVSSTSTALSSGTLANVDWSPASSTTGTGDLFALNIGANGNIGNIFNVKDSGSSVFSVSETAITANLPTSFTAPGDVSIAYDLAFTNQTASYIKSNAPLAIEAGETFESNNLTLRTYNSGKVVADTSIFQVGAGGTGVTTPGFFGLDVKSTTGDPSGGAEGYMYYNTFDNKFRCYQGSAWADCITTGGGTMSSFTAAGDSGSSQTISDANTLSILGGTNGIDTVASATDTLTLNLDTTEIGTTTFGSGSASTWTFDASAGTDTTIAFGNNTQTFTTGTATFSGDVVGQGTTGLTLSGAGAGVTISGTGNHTISTTNAGSNLTIGTTTTGALSLDSGTTGTVSLGNGNNAKTVNIGSGTAGNTINIAGTGATGADTINIGTGGTGADTINLGSSASSTALNLTSGTGSQTFSSSVATGTAFSFNTNSLSSGTGLSLASTSTALSSGNLAAIDWSPGSATTATGDLLSLNIGTNGNIGNIFNVKDTGSSVFSISETAITANLPTSFTAAGDVSFANNIAMTNQTASYLRSNAPLYLEAGETFESNDLTLRTYNSGQLVIDAAGGVNVNSVSYVFPSSQAAGSGYVLSNNGSGTLSWAAASTGTMSGFTAAGDTGSSQSITDSNTLSILGGTNGIDTVASATDTLTLNLDATEIGTTTFGSGSGFTWTFDAGATDPTLAFASNQITIGSAATLSATAVTTFNCTDCIDFDDIADSTTLDASMTLAQGANTWTQTFTGTSTTGSTYTANSVNTGIANAINTTALTSGSSLRITGSGATMTTGGELVDLVLGANTVGAGMTVTSTGAYTGVGAADGLINLTANSLTSGYAQQIFVNGLTSGRALNISSTSTALTTGSLGYLDWSPGSATNATGDLLSLNIGANGNVGNIFNVKDSGTSVFSISETQITSALPHQFTAAGDVGIAYDLAFTNQTASYIKSNAPLILDVGESFESNDLTLQTYNSGDITLDTGATGTINLANAVNFGAAQTFTAADTTPDVSGGSHFVTAGTATITDFDAGASGTLKSGHLIFIECATAVTFDVTSSGLIGGAADLVCGSGDLVTWIYDGTDWRLVSWMDNTDTQTGADLAEWYASNETLSPGEVVSIDKTNPDEAYVKKSASIRDSSTIGVVTTKPGITLGEPVNGKAFAIALAGRVPVKVSAANGPIEKGDYLTTSNTAGVATKATVAGPTIGKALTSFSGTGTGEVIVFVNISWYDPDAYLASLSGVTINPTDTTDKFSLTNAAGNLVSRIGLFSDVAIANISAGFIDAKKINLDGQNLADLIKQNTPTPQVQAASTGDFTQDEVKSLLDSAYHLQTASDTLSITKKLIAYGNVDIQGDLQVFGQTFIKGKATFEDETIFNKLVTFVSNTLFKGKVSFEDQVAFNKDAAGIAIIEKDNDSVTISFDKEYDTVPLVSATMVHEGEATSSAFLKTFYVTEKTKKGFKIKLDTPQSEDVSFNWIAINVNDPKVSKSSDATPVPSIDPVVQEGVDKLMKEATKSAQTTQTATPSAQLNSI